MVDRPATLFPDYHQLLAREAINEDPREGSSDNSRRAREKQD
jgi:hypothetical protein